MESKPNVAKATLMHQNLEIKKKIYEGNFSKVYYVKHKN